MRALRFTLALVFLGVVVYLGFDYATDSKLTLLGFGQDDESPEGSASFLGVALSAGTMFVGLMFGALYERLLGKSGAISISRELVLLFQSASFIRALLVAPVVFAGVYAVSQTQPDLIVAMIFAFQNGFFCEAIFREKHEAA